MHHFYLLSKKNCNTFAYLYISLKDVLHKFLSIAFMFNSGQLHTLTIHPIDTRICMVHLWTWNMVFWHHGPNYAVHP